MKTLITKRKHHPVRIPSGDVILQGELTIPDGACGLVVFAHGSGSSRLSPRNRMVAGEIQQRRMATLLFDLLTTEEALSSRERALVFNIPFLAGRLMDATRWIRKENWVEGLPVGFFGSSTGAAAALVAAAEMPDVRAVVSRGGRTDLAGRQVAKVHAATLLIVGELDHPVIRWNQESFHLLPGIRKLVLIPGATHLFQEPGALEMVAETAASWFEESLTRSSQPVTAHENKIS
jgi:putative phosphoribosyl transferase